MEELEAAEELFLCVRALSRGEAEAVEAAAMLGLLLAMDARNATPSMAVETLENGGRKRDFLLCFSNSRKFLFFFQFFSTEIFRSPGKSRNLPN